MNHYAKILSLLEALPEDQRMLMSGVRRGLVKDTLQPCGCLFGSLVPPDLVGEPHCNTLTFSSEAWATSPLAEWWVSTVSPTTPSIRDAVEELEFVNDRFMIGGKTASECRARYEHVCNYLRECAAEEAPDAE